MGQWCQKKSIFGNSYLVAEKQFSMALCMLLYADCRGRNPVVEVGASADGQGAAVSSRDQNTEDLGPYT